MERQLLTSNHKEDIDDVQQNMLNRTTALLPGGVKVEDTKFEISSVRLPNRYKVCPPG